MTLFESRGGRPNRQPFAIFTLFVAFVFQMLFALQTRFGFQPPGVNALMGRASRRVLERENRERCEIHETRSRRLVLMNWTAIFAER